MRRIAEELRLNYFEKKRRPPPKVKLLSLRQRAFTFERFVQQRLDVGLVGQAFRLGKPLRESDVGLWQSD